MGRQGNVGHANYTASLSNRWEARMDQAVFGGGNLVSPTLRDLDRVIGAPNTPPFMVGPTLNYRNRLYPTAPAFFGFF
jgi:hypothetical protein